MYPAQTTNVPVVDLGRQNQWAYPIQPMPQGLVSYPFPPPPTYAYTWQPVPNEVRKVEVEQNPPTPSAPQAQGEAHTIRVANVETRAPQDDLSEVALVALLGLFLFFFGGLIPGVIVWALAGCYYINHSNKRFRPFGQCLCLLTTFLVAIVVLPIAFGIVKVVSVVRDS